MYKFLVICDDGYSTHIVCECETKYEALVKAYAIDDGKSYSDRNLSYYVKSKKDYEKDCSSVGGGIKKKFILKFKK